MVRVDPKLRISMWLGLSKILAYGMNYRGMGEKGGEGHAMKLKIKLKLKTKVKRQQKQAATVQLL